MNKNVGVYGESVETKFQEWADKYEIPEHYEFQVKTLLSLQEEYNEVSRVNRENTEKRKQLLHMIQGIEARLPSGIFKEKPEEQKEIVKIHVQNLCEMLDRPFLKSEWDKSITFTHYLQIIKSKFNELKYEDGDV